ncbi:uncharacterized protein [Diabrotica undecimpunctata]|uniref:uncharacterized protein n=1 Tax=Diabrotica undecimpunctata TaxID=50387 RepID=UPI003B6389FA
MEQDQSVSQLVSEENEENLIIPLERFCTAEEIPVIDITGSETEMVECLFKETTKIMPDGTYQISIPFISQNNMSKVGDSYKTAQKRFLNVEKRLVVNTKVFNQYNSIIHNHLKVGILQIVKNPHPVVGKDQYFIPHFTVSKQKANVIIGIRVVYDGSCSTSNGINLNQVMLNYDNLQNMAQ